MLNLIFIEKLPVSYKKFFGGVLSFLKIILANTYSYNTFCSVLQRKLQNSGSAG